MEWYSPDIKPALTYFEEEWVENLFEVGETVHQTTHYSNWLFIEGTDGHLFLGKFFKNEIEEYPDKPFEGWDNMFSIILENNEVARWAPCHELEEQYGTLDCY